MEDLQFKKAPFPSLVTGFKNNTVYAFLRTYFSHEELKHFLSPSEIETAYSIRFHDKEKLKPYLEKLIVYYRTKYANTKYANDLEYSLERFLSRIKIEQEKEIKKIDIVTHFFRLQLLNTKNYADFLPLLTHKEQQMLFQPTSDETSLNKIQEKLLDFLNKHNGGRKKTKRVKRARVTKRRSVKGRFAVNESW